MESSEKKATHHEPPRLAEKFLDWYCKSEWVEPIKGDLYQQYQIDRAEGKLRASFRYWINMLNFLRPFAIKKNRVTSNYTAMLKNITKTFFRQLRRNPAQNAVNIFGLCIGFCVVFLTMLWINHHLSFDELHQDKDKIYALMTNSRGNDGEIRTTTGGIYEVMEGAKEQIPELAQVTRVISNWRWPSEQCLKIDENKPCIYSKGMFADSNFFEIFDFEIISGDPNPIRDPKSIALSESVAKKLYGDEDPIGKTYLVDNHFPVTITAIYKDVPVASSLQFEFIAPLDLAYSLWGQKEENMKEYSFITYVKLNSTNPALVERQINELSVSEKYENLDFVLHPLKKIHLYSRFENGVAKGGLIDYIYIIGLFALFILTMSIVNFINLTTAQSSIRGKEIGVRKVNGASKSSLHFQLLFETFLKVVIAALSALLIAYLVLPMLNSVIGEQLKFDLSLSLLLNIIAVVLLTTLLSGYYPAIVMSRFNPIQILKNLPLKGGNKGSVRKWLTIVQISISGIIVILTTAFYLQLNYIQNKNLGYDREGILMLEPTYRHIKGFESFTSGLLQHHQIKSIGISTANMINANYATDEISWNGKSDQEKVFFKLIGGDNGLFEVFGLEFLEGSGFNEYDTIDQVVLTESAVKTIGWESPIGRTIEVFGQKGKVSGVIKDFNTESLHENMIPTILYQVKPENSGTFYIRYDQSQALTSIELIEEEYSKLEPFFNMKSRILDEEYSKAYQDERIVSKLSSFTMIVALVIAIIGILGLSTFNILRRYREIGLRKIFGATRFQIIQILSKDFIIIVVLANVVAWAFSLWILDEWLSGFAYRIDTPYVILPINLVITLLLILGLVAIQALRVSKMNPSEVVRNE